MVPPLETETITTLARSRQGDLALAWATTEAEPTRSPTLLCPSDTTGPCDLQQTLWREGGAYDHLPAPSVLSPSRCSCSRLPARLRVSQAQPYLPHRPESIQGRQSGSGVSHPVSLRLAAKLPSSTPRA